MFKKQSQKCLDDWIETHWVWTTSKHKLYKCKSKIEDCTLFLLPNALFEILQFALTAKLNRNSNTKCNTWEEFGVGE